MRFGDDWAEALEGREAGITFIMQSTYNSSVIVSKMCSITLTIFSENKSHTSMQIDCTENYHLNIMIN